MELLSLHRFFNMISAIEIYHGAAIRNKRDTSAERRRRVDRITATIVDEGDRALVVSALRARNFLSLQERLDEIADECCKQIPVLCIGLDRATIVATRNYMAHPTQRNRARSANGRQLYILTEKIRIMVEICLLKSMDIPMSKVSELIMRRYYWRPELIHR